MFSYSETPASIPQGEPPADLAQKLGTQFRADGIGKRGRGRPKKIDVLGQSQTKVFTAGPQAGHVQQNTPLVNPTVVKAWAKESASALLATADSVYQSHMQAVGKRIKLTQEEIKEIAEAGTLKQAQREGIAEQISIIAVKYDMVGRFASEITLLILAGAYIGGMMTSLNRMGALVKDLKKLDEKKPETPKNQTASYVDAEGVAHYGSATQSS